MDNEEKGEEEEVGACACRLIREILLLVSGEKKETVSPHVFATVEFEKCLKRRKKGMRMRKILFRSL